MANLVETANTYGSNLEMLSAIKEGKVYGSKDEIKMFEEAAKYGQEMLVGNRFPEIEKAIQAGRNEVKAHYNLD